MLNQGSPFVAAAVQHPPVFLDLDLAMLDDVPGEATQYLMRGGSAIIAPSGEFLAGPIYEDSGLVTAEIDPQLAVKGRMLLDVAGHCARPDVFQLHVNTNPQYNVRWG